MIVSHYYINKLISKTTKTIEYIQQQKNNKTHKEKHTIQRNKKQTNNTTNTVEPAKNQNC